MSAYVGPIPRPVVPILALPRNRSPTLSRVTWYGVIRWALADSEQVRGVDAALLQPFELLHEHGGVDHDAVADDGDAAGGEDAGGEQVQGVLLVADDDGVTGVVAALVADDVVDRTAEQVGRLALALVAPLGADQHDRGHPELPADDGPAGGEAPQVRRDRVRSRKRLPGGR